MWCAAPIESEIGNSSGVALLRGAIPILHGMKPDNNIYIYIRTIKTNIHADKKEGFADA